MATAEEGAPCGLTALASINESPAAASPSAPPAAPSGTSSPGRGRTSPGRILNAVITRDPQGRQILTEETAYEATGFCYSTRKKWLILSAVFLVQCSMNYNAAIYGNAGAGLKKEFGIDHVMFKVGQMLFLVCYGFGCELWAPFSEELGRKIMMQISLTLVNLCQIPCMLAGRFDLILIFRALGGLSSAGGSVTLGMVADMWEPEDQQFAVAFVVLSSVLGSVIAPIAGGFIETYLGWRWVFYTQLIFGVAVQALHLCTPETRSTVLLDREAKRRRKANPEDKVVGPDEVRGNLWARLSLKEVLIVMWRPYKMLLREPIVRFLSLLSGFSDGLIFTGLDSFPSVLEQWDFTTITIGLSFISLVIGYFITYGMFLYRYYLDRKIIYSDPDKYPPERRLKLLLYLVLLEPIGLLILAFGAMGPPLPWIVSLLGVFLVGIANYAIYMATIDYMIAAYGAYSSSATGGNGFCRDIIAGFAALYTTPLYTKAFMPDTKWHLVIPTCLLVVIGACLCVPVYVFYIRGEKYRMKSPFAQTLAEDRDAHAAQRQEAINEHSPKGSPTNSRPSSRETSPERGAVEMTELASPSAEAQPKEAKTVNVVERTADAGQ